jgi:hypothetical protein
MLRSQRMGKSIREKLRDRLDRRKRQGSSSFGVWVRSLNRGRMRRHRLPNVHVFVRNSRLAARRVPDVRRHQVSPLKLGNGQRLWTGTHGARHQVHQPRGDCRHRHIVPAGDSNQLFERGISRISMKSDEYSLGQVENLPALEPSAKTGPVANQIAISHQHRVVDPPIHHTNTGCPNGYGIL